MEQQTNWSKKQIDNIRQAIEKLKYSNPDKYEKTLADFNEKLKSNILFEEPRLINGIYYWKQLDGTWKPENSNTVHCPYCGSTNIQIMKRGWKVTTGFLGSSKNERVCVNCMKKF